ncbi:MAG: non-homologous end-joining DNA ligase [Actinomycetota bacterium]
MEDRQIRMGNRSLELSNLDKVFYPETGFTKWDVVDYYSNIADVLVPHLRDRPITLKRYPNGVEGQHFYEKSCPSHRPKWVDTVAIRRKRDNKKVNYCLFNSKSVLLWAANLANLELHVSLDKRRDIGRPTAVVFDLDPGEGAGLLECAEVAVRLRELFDDHGVESFAKTSGSKGIQVYIPLNTKVTYGQTNPFARAVARRLESETPDEVTSNMAKAERKGKVFIDWSQNNQHKTTVGVYSLRGRPRPTVSTPVTWDEVDRALAKGDPDALVFEAHEVLRRVDKKGDLFEPVLKLRQRLPDL